jgi:hypothetical protein
MLTPHWLPSGSDKNNRYQAVVNTAVTVAVALEMRHRTLLRRVICMEMHIYLNLRVYADTRILIG